MIILKSFREIECMKKAGCIAKTALHMAGDAIKPGISTYEIDRIIHDYITSQNAQCSFLNYNGFPKSACISINDEVIHGIPSKRRIINEGDIVSIDVGAKIDGFHGDCAWTFTVGEVSDEVKKLCDVTRQCLEEAVKVAYEGNHIGDIGYAVQSLAQQHGYGVVREFVGHGIGANLHEEPDVPNTGAVKKGIRLKKGMTIAIEPMINLGTAEVVILDDGWTVKTLDHKPSAHFEYTIAITDNDPIVLTRL